MPNVISNPLFQVIILFIVATGSWFLVTDETVLIKKKVLNFVTDSLYYFILTSFGLNLIINFKKIIQEPYRIILLSSTVSWIALIFVMVYLGYRESKKQVSSTELQNKLINHTVNFMLFLGLFNHLFYYYKYRNSHSVIFILVYFLLYLLKDRIKLPRINESIFLLLALIHGIVMFSFSKIILYYQIVFYSYQIISLFVLASLIIFYFRRNFLSKQK